MLAGCLALAHGGLAASREGRATTGLGGRDQAAATEAQSFVTVVDTENRPVLGLGSEDFSLRDGAVRQPIVAVEPAVAPLAVAVVLDGFEASDAPAVTQAITQIVQHLAQADPAHQVGGLTGAGSTRAIRPLTARDVAGYVATRLAPGTAGAPSVTDALADGCRVLANAPSERRAVIGLLRRRQDRLSVPTASSLTDAMLLSKVAVWTVELGAAGTSPIDRALTDAATIGGALRQTASATTLSDLAGRTADLLVSQYLVTYMWPNPMLSQLTISLRHDRGAVLTPLWMR